MERVYHMYFFLSLRNMIGGIKYTVGSDVDYAKRVYATYHMAVVANYLITMNTFW